MKAPLGRSQGVCMPHVESFSVKRTSWIMLLRFSMYCAMAKKQGQFLSHVYVVRESVSVPFSCYDDAKCVEMQQP